MPIRQEALPQNSSGARQLVEIIALGIGGKRQTHRVAFVPGAPEPSTVSVPLPETGNDFLVTIAAGLWLDSLRTE